MSDNHDISDASLFFHRSKVKKKNSRPHPRTSYPSVDKALAGKIKGLKADSARATD
jgi:hypothetical protein